VLLSRSASQSKLNQLLYKATDSLFNAKPETAHLFCSSVGEKDCTGKKTDQPRLELRFLTDNKFRQFAFLFIFVYKNKRQKNFNHADIATLYILFSG